MILLLRHGQTEFNAERRMQGHLDAPLTALGREQASRMGARVAAIAAGRRTVIHASPLGRALATARLVAAAFAAPPPIRPDPRLKEISVGAWEGRTMEEIQQGWPGHRERFPPGEWLFNAPGGETIDILRARAGAALSDILADPAPVRVIVAHGVTNWVLRMAHTGLGPAETLIKDLPQDAVFELGAGGGLARLDDGD